MRNECLLKTKSCEVSCSSNRNCFVNVSGEKLTEEEVDLLVAGQEDSQGNIPYEG